MLSFFIDAASGVLAVLPFLIILEIAARRLIPVLPLRHLAGAGLLSFLLAALLSVAHVPGLYQFCAGLRFSLVPFSQIPVHPLWYALYLLFFLLLGTMLPLLFPFFRKWASASCTALDLHSPSSFCGFLRSIPPAWTR